MNGPDFKNEYGGPRREPMFNLPAAVGFTALTLVLVHVVLSLLPIDAARGLVIDFAFIPARFSGLPSEWAGATPAGPVWGTLTMVSHAAFHGNWAHLGFNVLWLLAFGTPVARVLGGMRYGVLFVLCAVGGAAAFWVAHPEGLVPVVGASGAISGLMAASIRLMLAGGPLSRRFLTYTGSGLAPLSSARFLAFTAAWLGINLVFGLAGSAFSEGGIAWEAHMGGYFVGALVVGFLMPHRTRA